MDNGHRNWHVASIRQDGSFWGYVHARTTSLNENRSFDGQLDTAENEKIRILVESVDNKSQLICKTKKIDGLIGTGSRSDLETILGYNRTIPTTRNDQLFRKIVEILQPIVNAAAKLP